MFLAFNGDDNKGERQWITISGTHVPLDEDGGLGGKVGEKIEKKKTKTAGGKGQSQGSVAEQTEQMERESCKSRLRRSFTEENLQMAKGKTYEELQQLFGNSPIPIAVVPKKYLTCFKGKPKDHRLFCGMAYMLDHAVNHHPNIPAREYENIQDILDHPDIVRKDNRISPYTNKSKDVLLFLKKINHNQVLAIELSEADGNIILHKSLSYTRRGNPYAGLPLVNSATWDCRPQINANRISDSPAAAARYHNDILFPALEADKDKIIQAFDKVNGYEPKSFNQIILDAKSSIALAKKLLTRRTF